jgi:hypothetical protein
MKVTANMRIRVSPLLVVMGLSLVPPHARADEAADQKAELERKKEAAKVRAAEKKAAAEKAATEKAAAEKAAADKAAADKAAADKAAADKAAADKAAADKAKSGGGGTGSGGASGTGGASSKGAGGGGSGGTGGAASTKAADKADKAETDAPLPVGDIEALRKDRPDRRKVSVERLRKRWGSVLANTSGAAELKAHSRRVALLQRARVIAESKKDKASVELADELLTAEDDRHSSAMNALREGALK